MSGDDINQVHTTDDTTVMEVGFVDTHGVIEFDGHQFGVRGNGFGGMDQERPTITGNVRPVPVFNVFETGDNQPGPRLANTQTFHVTQGKVFFVSLSIAQLGCGDELRDA